MRSFLQALIQRSANFASVSRRARLRLAALAFVALLASLAAWPWPVSDGLLQQAVRLGKFAITKTGAVEFSILPSPRITARQVSARTADGQAKAEIARIVIAPEILPLVWGEFRPKRVAVTGAEISSASGLPQLGPLIAAAMGRDGFAASSSSTRLSGTRIRVTDGVETLESLEIDWRPGQAAKPFELTARGLWQGRAFDVSASGPAPGTAEGPAALAFESGLLKASFKGLALTGGEPRFRGLVSADSGQPGEAAAWLGAGGLLPPNTGRMAISGEWNGTLEAATLSKARARYESVSFDGALAIRAEANRLKLSGTLAAEKADISGLIAILSPRRLADGGWSREQFNRLALACCDLDLRLSGQNLTAGPLALDRGALSLMLRAGRLEINIGEAAFGGGSAKGRIAVQPTQLGFDVKAQGQIERADAAVLLGRGFGLTRLTGLGSLQFSLEANGANTAEIAESISGRIAASVEPGQLIGVDLDRLLLRLERRSALVALDAPQGVTNFHAAQLTAALQRGRLDDIDIALRSPTLNVTLKGQGDIPRRLLNFNGVLASQPGKDGEKTSLPFTVNGLWDSPNVTPLIDKLQRRS